jgi:putative selenate reductase FAD-binding subunit
MITEYFRPQTLEEALQILSQPDTRPLGGGTWLNQPHLENFAVVDLQALGLNRVLKNGNNLEVDACVTLQQLLESSHTPDALKQAIKQEVALNIRNMATVAGILVTADGRSPFACAMLALDARLETAGDPASSLSLGEFLSLRPKTLILKIIIPLNAKISFDQVARTSFDRPIVCAAVTRWASGRTRLVLGGTGKAPLLAMDGTEADGIDSAAKNAFHEAADEWASAEYRMDVAATLAKRCLEALA